MTDRESGKGIFVGQTVPMQNTVRQRRLAREIRSLRDAAGWTTTEAAQHLSWSKSRLNRLETGAAKATEQDVAEICDVYKVTESVRTALVQLVRDSARHGWWTAYSDVFAGSYVGLEDEASLIKEWGVQLVPGLLQTEDYAREIISTGLGNGDAEQVYRRVMARMARKTLLGRPNPPGLHAVIDEAVLHRPIGGPEVMREQLRALIIAARRPNVTIQVLPFGVGVHAGMDGSFILLEYANPADDVAYVAGTAGDVYVENPEHVTLYKMSFKRICSAALTPDASQAMIAAAMKE
ncbi:helix-turn-helix transcriptional regulator [Streptosporangium sp. NPDC050280]|uniref:helix-turn-helix domain-containing protein n=1 Tax=unclassified Streptosporangium TaxID=2632669 RepID=UPI00342679D0